MLFSDWKLPFFVKGFLAWLLLSALFLQLSEPVSDALSFGQCAYIGAKCPLHEGQLCARGVFRFQTPRAYYPPKKKFGIIINIFPLFRLVRAKTRENT